MDTHNDAAAKTESLEEMIRVKTEELAEANKQLQKYKIFTDYAKDIILLLDVNGWILEANATAVQTYGYTREELTALNIGDLRKSGPQQVSGHAALAGTEAKLFETVHKRKDGRLFYAEINCRSITIGDERVFMCIIRDISKRKQAEQQLKKMATHDQLTRIPNRYYLEKCLEEAALNSGEETGGMLLLLGIDNFKVINDAYGYAAGDKVLIDLTKILKAIIGQNDLLARLGGDEFVIVLHGASIDDTKRLAQKIISTLNERDFIVDSLKNCCKVSVSIGISKIGGADTQEILANADVALYQAKEDGKSRVVCIEEQAQLFATNAMVRKLNESLNNNGFILHYQPIMSGHRIVHYEALIRIADHGGKKIYPNAFISTAERFGFMSRIDRWVIKSVINTLADHPQLAVFVNISPSTLEDDELLTVIENSLSQKKIQPDRLGFEITETAAVRNLDKAKQWIGRLKKIGCKFALDDFGVGFTSFADLQMLPVDYIKIDGTFIKNIDKDSTQKAIVQAINTVAHALGKTTIAEFVENETVWQSVRDVGVDLCQGYFFGKPNSIDELFKAPEELCVNG